MSNLRILIIDDEQTMLTTYDTLLRMRGYDQIQSYNNPVQALEGIKEAAPDVVLLDLMMGAYRGEDYIESINRAVPGVKVVIVTALDTIDGAVTCIRKGARDYLVKPLDQDRLISLLISFEKEKYMATPSHGNKDDAMQYASPCMHNLVEQVKILSPTNLPILITGETGTGKEVMARYIHDYSARMGDLVSVNTAGLDEAMFSDTLFGHQKGAFTGAHQGREGLLCRAQEGSLFLDEIGDLDMRTQVKLLRLLQENEYYPVGSDELRQTSTRFIMATHVDLAEKVREGSFREDLYYRLSTHRIHIPPLRERREDIPVLIEYFLDSISSELNRSPRLLPLEVQEEWQQLPFAGNVRELEGMVKQFLLFGTISPPAAVLNQRPKNPDSHDHLVIEDDSFPTIKEVSDKLVDEALKRSGGKQVQAAKLLGITQQALSARLKKRKPV
ncbi:MAG: sigma-54-dependent Fis family transcriptional regulator [Planctomycetes bacterium]|nr:sigma-54-dependent Fis family transcriptional regulator [Planctomycetota bacterium]